MSKECYVIELENDKLYPPHENFYVKLTKEEYDIINWFINLVMYEKQVDIIKIEKDIFSEVEYEHKKG